VRQAIESAVYALIMEGVLSGLWEFADPDAGREALATYAGLVGEAAQVASLRPAADGGD